MGLLDFDKTYKPPFKPSWGMVSKDIRKVDSNFFDLQNLGRTEVSEDFSDSPFADRRPEAESEHV